MLHSGVKKTRYRNQGIVIGAVHEFLDGKLAKRYSTRMLIGYARVSTKHQNLESQEAALRKAGCEQIVVEIASGKREDRSGLDELCLVIRKGDVIVVCRLERLGGSPKKLSRAQREIVAELYRERKQSVKAICKAFGISKTTLYSYVSQTEWLV